jgi:hypothetical protein
VAGSATVDQPMSIKPQTQHKKEEMKSMQNPEIFIVVSLNRGAIVFSKQQTDKPANHPCPY